MKNKPSDLTVECELPESLPMLPEEMKLLQDLLPELLKIMQWLQDEKE